MTYQKDAFEYGDRSWRAAVEILRGIGPLLPKRAKDLLYPENTSPLARLFKAYRRNDAGGRCLIPGDGRKPIHDETRRWGREFQKGNPDYQTDERWWQAVLDHGTAKLKGGTEKVSESTPTRADEAEVSGALGVSKPTEADPQANHKADAQENPESTETPTTTSWRPAPPAKETKQERIARYVENSTTYPSLSRAFGHPRIGHVEVEVRRLTTGHLIDEHANPTPVLMDQQAGNAFTAFLDLDHEVYQRFGVEPADLLLAEVASVMRVRSSTDWSLSQLMAAIRAESLPGTALDSDMIAAEARDLLAEIRRRMAGELDRIGEPAKAFQHLSPDELTATEHAMIANGRVTQTSDLGASGDFLLHVPALFLVRLLEELPIAFMDNHVFRGLYAGISSGSAQRMSLARVAGYLADVATQASYSGTATSNQLLRARLSMRLLEDELADEL